MMNKTLLSTTSESRCCTLYGKSHAILGAAGGFLAGTYIEAPFIIRVIMGAIGAFGGLLPDADTQSSILGRYLPSWWHKWTPGHRGLTHSLFYCGIVFLVVFAGQQAGVHLGIWGEPESPYVPIAVTVGALTHLFADGLTVQGVPLLYPVYKRKIKLLGPLSFKTGSGVEPAVVSVLLSIAVAYVLMPYTEGIADAIETPTIFSIQTENIVVFVVSVILIAVVLTTYRLSKSPKSKRRSPKSKRTKAKRT